MNEVLFALAVLVWLVAAYAFLRILATWYAAYRAAEPGQGIRVALEMGTLNHAAVQRRLGDAAAPMMRTFRGHMALFAGCVAVFVGLIVINIASGNAA